MTFGDLFAGIGGFRLGLERAGHECKWACEIDPFCRRVYLKHWPDTNPFYEDIRDVQDPPYVDMLCGGFPCQDLSVAGRQAGIDGERSGLWSEFARLIRTVRPRIAFVENVPGLLVHGMGRVLGDLAESGYDAEWQSIPAAAVGAPHQRDRVWILAYPVVRGCRKSGKGRELASVCRGGVHDASAVTESSDVANSQSLRVERDRTARQQESQTQTGEGISGRHGPGAGETDWPTEPNVGRVVDGLSLELDIIRRVENETQHNTEKKSEVIQSQWSILRSMWKHRALATASPQSYICALFDCLPEMPHGDTQSRWLLGAWIEGDEELCDLWRRFYTQSFKEAQDLQRELLKRIRQKKRPQALGSRSDRLKSLGNAVVPQVVEWIGRRISESNRTVGEK